MNVTRKIRRPLPKPAGRSVVNTYAIWCVETTPTEIATAFRIEDEHRIGFRDALSFAAASKSGATRVVSEDLNDGQVIRGVRIGNPLKTGIVDRRS